MNCTTKQYKTKKMKNVMQCAEKKLTTNDKLRKIKQSKMSELRV